MFFGRQLSLIVFSFLVVPASCLYGQVAIWLDPINASAFGGCVYPAGGGNVTVGQVRIFLDADGVGGFYYTMTAGSSAPVSFCVVEYLGIEAGFSHFRFDGHDVYISSGEGNMPGHGIMGGRDAMLVYGTANFANRLSICDSATMPTNCYTSLRALSSELPAVGLKGIVVSSILASGGSGGGGGGGGDSPWTPTQISTLLSNTISQTSILNAIALTSGEILDETEAMRQATQAIEALIRDGIYAEDGETALLEQIRDILDEGEGFSPDERAIILLRLLQMDQNILNIKNTLPQLLADQLGQAGAPYLLQIRNKLTEMNTRVIGGLFADDAETPYLELAIERLDELYEAQIRAHFGELVEGELPEESYLARIAEALDDEEGEGPSPGEVADPADLKDDVASSVYDYADQVELFFLFLRNMTDVSAPNTLDLELSLPIVGVSIDTEIPIHPSLLGNAGPVLVAMRGVLGVLVVAWGLIACIRIFIGD